MNASAVDSAESHTVSCFEASAASLPWPQDRNVNHGLSYTVTHAASGKMRTAMALPMRLRSPQTHVGSLEQSSGAAGHQLWHPYRRAGYCIVQRVAVAEQEVARSTETASGKHLRFCSR